MTASSSSESSSSDRFEQSVQAITALNEQVVQRAKEGGQAYLDAYEKSLKSMLDLELKAAESTQLDWMTALAGAHAQFVQDMTSAYVSAARQVMR